MPQPSRSRPPPPEVQQLRQRVAELEDQLEREKNASATLRDVARAMGRSADLDGLLGLVLAKAAELLEADRATLYLTDETSGELVSRRMVGAAVQTIRVAPGQGIAGNVLQSGRTIRVRDAYEDPRFSRDWDAVTGYRTKAILAAPMKTHLGQTIGVLQVLNKHGAEAFSEEDQELLDSLAAQAAISIDVSKLLLRLERKVADLKLLFDLESAMAWAATQDELVLALLRETVVASCTRAGVLVLTDSATGRHLQYVVRSDDPGALGKERVEGPNGALASAMREGVAVRAEGHDAVLPDAHSVVAVPLTGEDGLIVGGLALCDRVDKRPFTDDDIEMLRLVAANASTAISLQRARETREVNERLSAIGRLLSTVLHDLKTPMTVIAGYAQLLALAEDAAQREEYAELILKQFEHITNMQREVLAFARGETTLFVSKVYLTQFFEQIKAQVERELAGRAVSLKLQVEDRGTVRFDHGKITRAIHNLIRNALDAMGVVGGELTVGVRREGADVVMWVSDTGPGIPSEIENKLFESFVTAGKPGGTGLGLAIVKKIVEEHGGSVSVQSGSQGATFTLTLPQKD